MEPGDVAALRALDAKLEFIRHQSRIAYDMSYAALWWASLGASLADNNPRFDFPARALDEANYTKMLRDSYGKAPDENPDCDAVMALGARVIAEAGTRKLDPDGYLGALKVIRSAFAFLERDFGLVLVHAHIDKAI